LLFYVSGFRQPHDHRNTKAAGVAQNATGAAQEAAGAHYAPAAQNPRTAGESNGEELFLFYKFWSCPGCERARSFDLCDGACFINLDNKPAVFCAAKLTNSILELEAAVYSRLRSNNSSHIARRIYSLKNKNVGPPS
jgi:hypothetical protein